MCFKELLTRIRRALYRSTYEEIGYLRIENSLLQDQINSEVDVNRKLVAEVHRLKVLNDGHLELRNTIEQQIIYLTNIEQDLRADVKRLTEDMARISRDRDPTSANNDIT
jgi:hypothetical protein